MDVEMRTALLRGKTDGAMLSIESTSRRVVYDFLMKLYLTLPTHLTVGGFSGLRVAGPTSGMCWTVRVDVYNKGILCINP